MLKNLKVNSVLNVNLCVLLFISLIITCFYFIQFSPKSMLYIIYSFIGLLFILIHGLLIKYFNLSFMPSKKPLTIENIHNKYNTYKLVLKLFFIQSEIFLLSNWLFQNILLQSKLHHKFFNFLQDVNLDNFLVSFSNVFINWLIFVGFLLGLGIFKYYFKINDVHFAKCLIYNPHNYFKIFLYNLLLGIEFYLRFTGMYLLFIITLVGLFEYFAKKYLLYSFLGNSILIVFLNILLFICFKKPLAKFINFLCKRQIIDFINVLMIMFLISGIIIFVINQIVIKYLYFIDILPMNNSINYQALCGFLNISVSNPKYLEVLFVGLNFVLIINAVNNFIINKIYFCKIGNLYFMSLGFPMVYSLLIYKFKLSELLQGFFTKDIVNLTMLFIIIYIFNINYKKIYHLFCFFNLGILKNGIQKRMKVNYNILINKLVFTFWVNLIFYYNFSYIFIENFVAIGMFLGLLIIISLIFKIFSLLRRDNLEQLIIFGQRT